ncbi:MAG: iron ABC transporter permease [Bacillota bacterium]|nr:iron ABC transporter permease [Bacillota bacterium]
MWERLWKNNKPDPLLVLSGLLTALLMAMPVVIVIWRAVMAGTDRWARLIDSRIPQLLQNTLQITLATTFLAILLGVSLAWLVYRCDLPGRNIWQWLLALPLMLPPYVGAVSYIMVFGPNGWIQDLAGELPFNIYSFWGVLLVMTLFKFPYVFLISGAALKRMNRSYEDTARSLGLGSWEIFRKVNLPFLRPAIGAGAILTALCVLSEFGVIAIMRYNTFTSAIYYQMESFDRLSATVLSVILIILTLGFLWLESIYRKNQKYYQTCGTFQQPDLIRLAKWKVPAMIWVFLIFLLSVIIPVGVLIYWSGYGIALGALDSNFFGYTLNSIKVAGIAALLSMALALPLVYLKSRHPSVPSELLNKISSAGYSLPGVIVALGLIFIFNTYIPWLYNTFYLISIAYLVRFLPQAIQYGNASLSMISPRIDEAARNLGYRPLKVLFKVILPLLSPGLMAGGALVFVSAIKELPATLLLRPPGFDTLAVRVWVEASDAVYHMAAPAALLVVLVSVIPLKLMLSRY